MAKYTGRRQNGEGSIRKRGDGRWEGRVMIGQNPETGKPIFKYVYGDSMREVRAKMKELPANQDESSIEVPPILFGDWLSTWLTQYKTNSVTPATYESYRIIIEHHLKPSLGSVPIKEITPEQIQKLLNSKQEQGARKDGKEGTLSASSVMKIKIVINASLKQAVKNRLIPYNPTEAVTPPKMVRSEIRVLTSEEQNIFVQAAKEHRLEALFKLALATGMRKGELLALTWDNIDFENRTITINKSASRIRDRKTMKTVITVGSPKSASGFRQIPMLPSVVPILENHYLLQQKERKEAGRTYNMTGLVFCSNIGTYIEPRRINTTLGKIIKKAKLEHINFHALRHTFATRALEAGISPRIVQEVLGHSDVSLTLNRYTHVLKSTAHEQMKKMDDLFKAMEAEDKPAKKKTKTDRDKDKSAKNKTKADRGRER